MTVPAPGAPDFAALLPWRSSNLLGLFSESYAPGHTFTPILPATTYASIGMRFAPTANSFEMTIHWFSDINGTVEVGSDQYALSPSHNLQVYFPTEAAFFQLDVDNVGATSDTVTQYLFLTNTPTTRPVYPVVGSSTFGVSVSVPASSTFADVIPFYCKGRGHVRINTGAAAGQLVFHVSQTDVNGNLINALLLNSSWTGQVEYDYPHPDLRLAIFFDNTDAAAAHTVTYSWWVSDDV